jgi:agmatinase
VSAIIARKNGIISGTAITRSSPISTRILKTGFEGQSWKQIADEIVSHLPEKVYISFDIDGLDPKLCPHTGTPVPGGFETEQIFYLIR